MRWEKFTPNRSSWVTLQLDCGLLLVFQTGSYLMENCHILGYFQLHWGQASNSKTLIFVLDFCSIYKTKAPQYDYVFFVIQKSNFSKIFHF